MHLIDETVEPQGRHQGQENDCSDAHVRIFPPNLAAKRQVLGSRPVFRRAMLNPV
jgi:hypothetical protein